MDIKRIWFLMWVVLCGSSTALAVGSGQSGVNSSGGPLERVRFCGLSNGPHTIKTYTTNVNQHVGADPYMYLFKEDASGNFYYYGENDDGAGGPLGRDALISFSFSTANDACIFALITSYADSSYGYGTKIYLDGQLKVTVDFGGKRWAHGWNGLTWLTCILPGGQYAYCPHQDVLDTIKGNRYDSGDRLLYLIKRTPGALVEHDDDSGVSFEARISPYNGCDPANGDSCVVVAGPWTTSTQQGGFFSIIHNAWTDADADRDGLTAPIETYFNSSDHAVDSDGDGLKDYWEVIGKESSVGAVDDCWYGPCSIELYQDEARPASNHQDLFLQLSYMEKSGGDSDLPRDAQGNLLWKWMDDAFYQDSDYTGRAIYTHVLTTGPLMHVNFASLNDCAYPLPSGFTSLRAIKSDTAVFNPTELGVYHFMVAAHKLAGSQCVDASDGQQGESERPGNDSIMFESNYTSPQGRAGSHLHEIGHQLGLDHWLAQHLDPNAPYCVEEHATGSQVHLSVMNYAYAGSGFADQGTQHYGFSRGQNGCSSLPSPKCGCGSYAGTYAPYPSIPSIVYPGCDCDRDEWTEHNPPDASPTYIHLDCNIPSGFGIFACGD